MSLVVPLALNVDRNRTPWIRDELILTLSLYFQLPFGRLNHSTPEVKELAYLVGRTSNAVALRLVNFAACDPYIINSGRTGMTAGISVCRPIWNEFVDNKESLFFEAQQIKANILNQSVENILAISPKELEGKERDVVVKQRINQSAFRSMILQNYEKRCAISGINIPELLVASHIIPWADSTAQQKLNPENGICLSSLYDKAFDRGLITISPDDYTISLSSALLEYETKEYFNKYFGCIDKNRLILPIEHIPNRDFLAYHRDNIFRGF